MPHAYSVKQSEEICRTLNALRLGNSLSDIYLEHVKTMTHSVFFMLGCKGKVVNAGFFSAKHRTTVAHFLNNGKWDSPNFEKALKRQVIDRIYPEKSFGEAKALRVFISTHTELTAQEILNIYAKRWNIEVFFRNCKQKLAFDKCQLRKKQGITRMWLILSFIHFLCCTVSGCVGSFDEGHNYFRNCVLQEIFAQNALSM